MSSSACAAEAQGRLILLRSPGCISGRLADQMRRQASWMPLLSCRRANMDSVVSSCSRRAVSWVAAPAVGGASLHPSMISWRLNARHAAQVICFVFSRHPGNASIEQLSEQNADSQPAQCCSSNQMRCCWQSNLRGTQDLTLSADMCFRWTCLKMLLLTCSARSGG